MTIEVAGICAPIGKFGKIGRTRHSKPGLGAFDYFGLVDKLPSPARLRRQFKRDKAPLPEKPLETCLIRVCCNKGMIIRMPCDVWRDMRRPIEGANY